MAWRVIEYAPEITACDAMIAASVASATAGQISAGGNIR